MDKNLLAEIVQVMDRMYGRDISLYDDGFLAKTIESRSAAAGVPSAEVYLRHLAENSAEAQTFLQSLNITYSEFFRDPLAFAILEKTVLPSLAAKEEKAGRTELRVWSAACAAGQEAYSVAILLDDPATARGGAVTFRIFATDHSDAAIAAAQEGVYEHAEVRNVRMKHVRDYFIQEGDSYSVIRALKDRVDFSVYDLLDERAASPPPSIYGEFDLIICSNLLFYYRQDIRRRILSKVWKALSSSGYLVTSEAEADIAAGHGGFRAAIPASAVFQKTRRGA